MPGIVFGALAALLIGAILAVPALTRDRRFGFDFSLRHSEVRCLRQGIDPFDVWSGKVHSKNFIRMKHNKKTPAQAFVHCYAPWEYSFVWPLSLLPLRAARAGMYALNSACLLGLAAWTWRLVRRRHGGSRAAACAAILLAFGFNSLEWMSLLFCGNWGGVFAVALAMLAFALERDDARRQTASARGGGTRRGLASLRWQALAGAALAVLMFKPQVGVLFVIPLALDNKWPALFFSAGICLLASVPPALLCGKTPIELILEVGESAAAVYRGSALIPPRAQQALMNARKLDADAVMLISMALGILLCSTLAFLQRRGKDWLAKLIPAALLATMWTYSMEHDLCLWSVPAAWMLARAAGAGRTAETVETDVATGTRARAHAWLWRGASLFALLLGAVACYRTASDWLTIAPQYWRPFLMDAFPWTNVFNELPDAMKMREKGSGYEYKRVLFVLFAAYAATTAHAAARIRRHCAAKKATHNYGEKLVDSA